MIPGQLAEDREYEDVIREGELYRLVTPKKFGDNSAFYYADADGGRIVFTFIQTKSDENATKKIKLRIARADANATYFDRLTGRRYGGDELRAGIEVETKAEKFVDRRYFVKE